MNENKCAKRPPVFIATALIAFGLLFLLDNIGVLEFSWWFVLILIGAVMLIEAIINRRPQSVFPGTFLLLLGMIFLADDIWWLRGGVSDNWPLVLVALGLSFFASYFVQPKSRGLIIPGGILLGLGIIFFFAEHRFIRWYTIMNILHWWPILFIGLGLWLLLRKRPA